MLNRIHNSHFNLTDFSNKTINSASDLVNKNCNFESSETFKNKNHLDNELCFQLMQLIHAMPLIWKQIINESRKNAETNYVLQDHYLIKTLE